MLMIEYISDSLEDTKKIAIMVAQDASVGDCFALYGDLGAGKTTFASYFIQCISPTIESVCSPTFTIVQTYKAPICDIWHVDCYRLESEDEFQELGLHEAFDNCITIIEWPEIIEHHLPDNITIIKFLSMYEKRKIYIHKK